jgi:sec-independent protein translocase protein TatA
MLGLGTTEIILIVAVLFLLFGASRLPQLAKSFGQTRKAFKDGMREAEEEERVEEEQRKISSVNAPQINAMSDEALVAEMRRRVEAKQQ